MRLALIRGMPEDLESPGLARLEAVFNANATWRDIISDAAMRSAVLDACEEDDLVDYFNECGEDEDPEVTFEDLCDFLQPIVLEIQEEFKAKEESGGYTELDAIFFWRAAEDADTECLLEYLEERYPRFHAYVISQRDDN